MKDIFLSLPAGVDPKPITAYSISIAQAFSAHLTAAAISFKQIVVGSPFEGVAAAVIAGTTEEEKEKAKSAATAFNNAVAGTSILSDTRLLHEDPATACEWFAARARHYDLTVCPQADPAVAGDGDLLIEAALFSSGRPVLIVPYIQRADARFERIAVCWNGSSNAARAVHDAMPILKKSKKIEILCVTEKSDTGNELSGSEIAAHLARHDLKVEVKPLPSSRDLGPADAVLSYIAENETDLMVMGAYGHSRLREFILGGMTRDILRSMTVPTLMSH